MTIFSPTLEKACQLTGRSFPISEREKSLWDHFGIALPVVAPEERLRRMYAFLGGPQLYVRECDALKRRIPSAYTDHAPFPVFETEYWTSRAWNPFSFGQQFQFKRLFMEQFLELWRNVPRPAAVLTGAPPETIANDSNNLDGCFSVFQSESCRECFYGVRLVDCVECLDGYELSGCRECYEGVFLQRCTRLRFSECCKNCEDSWLLSNCVDCKYCFGCTHLRGARYCIFNEQVTREEYLSTVSGFGVDARPLLELARNRFRELLLREPTPHIYADQPRANSGNYLRNTQLCIDSFFCSDATDLVNCAAGSQSRMVLDSVLFRRLESSVQAVGCSDGLNLLCCVSCTNGVERLAYCSHCSDSRDLFGCIGLTKAQYCIFNTQFTPDEYTALRARIEQHMRGRGVWGSFFPPGFSGFPYNRSFAGDLMPLTKIPAKMMNFPWDDSDEHLTRPSALVGAGLDSIESHFHELPERAGDVTEQQIEQLTFLCSVTGQPYHISSWELRFAKRHGVPLPECAFAHRHALRLSQCTPFSMFERVIAPSGATVRTSVPERWKQPLAEAG